MHACPKSAFNYQKTIFKFRFELAESAVAGNITGKYYLVFFGLQSWFRPRGKTFICGWDFPSAIVSAVCLEWFNFPVAGFFIRFLQSGRQVLDMDRDANNFQ